MQKFISGLLPLFLCAACSQGSLNTDSGSNSATDPSYQKSAGKSSKGSKSKSGVVVSPVTIHASATPSWDMKGKCVHNVNFLSTDTRWSNIGTYQDPPSYRYEILHSPNCNGKVVFHWDGSPNDSSPRHDSFAEIELKQY